MSSDTAFNNSGTLILLPLPKVVFLKLFLYCWHRMELSTEEHAEVKSASFEPVHRFGFCLDSRESWQKRARQLAKQLIKQFNYKCMCTAAICLIMDYCCVYV